MADNSTFPEVFEDKLNPELSAEQKDHLARRLSRARAIELDSDPVKGNLDRDHFSDQRGQRACHSRVHVAGRRARRLQPEF